MKILIVDDDQWVRVELQEFLAEQGYTVFQAGLPSEAWPIIASQEPDIVILDLKLPEMDGLEVLQRLKAASPDIEVIMITGHGDLESAIQALRLGASDYLTKPFRLAEVQAALERTHTFLQVKHQLQAVEFNYAVLAQELHDRAGYPIIGQSAAMRTVLELMTKVAQADHTPVLLIGESGAGKELIARGIHRLSARNGQMFCAVNMAAITETLFESEFFGHKKGAFTGASEDKPGWFQVAQAGTLFLDEIGSMPLTQQAKLLRVLEENTVTRVGTHKPIPVDVRILAATNKDLQHLIAAHTFREDLYYRLSAFVIAVPPLRQHPDDIAPLVESFVAYFSQNISKPVTTIDPRVISALQTYQFPGNIRELKNMVERAIILCDGETLSLQHFPDIQPRPADSPTTVLRAEDIDLDLDARLAATEKQLILQALEQAQQNKSKAAELLGISRQSLHRRLDRLGVSA